MNRRPSSLSRYIGNELSLLGRSTTPKKRSACPTSAATNGSSMEQASSAKKAKVALADNPWHFDSDNLSTLPIIYRKPPHVPIYADPKFDGLSTKAKVAKIMEHHVQLAKIWRQFILAQETHRKFGPPIEAKFVTNDDWKKKDDSRTVSISNAESTYVSRSGRHVRSRILPNFATNDASDEEESADAAQGYKSFAKGKQKKTSLLTQNENSPRLINTLENRSQRGEAILRESQKQSLDESKSERFKKSLNFSSDSDVETLCSPNKFLKSPELGKNAVPLRQRNILSNSSKTNALQFDLNDYDTSGFNGFRQKMSGPEAMFKALQQFNQDEDAQSSSKRSDDAFGRTMTNHQEVNEGASTSSLNKFGNHTSGKKRGPKIKMTDCPICSGSFPMREIEEHASTCGVTSVLEIQSNLPSQIPDLY